MSGEDAAGPMKPVSDPGGQVGAGTPLRGPTDSSLPARKASPIAFGTRASDWSTRARFSAVEAFISCSRAMAMLRRSSALARATRVSASA